MRSGLRMMHARAEFRMVYAAAGCDVATAHVLVTPVIPDRHMRSRCFAL